MPKRFTVIDAEGKTLEFDSIFFVGADEEGIGIGTHTNLAYGVELLFWREVLSTAIKKTAELKLRRGS